MIHSAKDFINDLWCDLANKPEKSPLHKPLKKIPSLEKLRISEWCPEFETLMRNRLIMGAFRYGLIAEQDFSKYDIVSEIYRRIKRYTDSNNLETLVDASNMLMLEFIKARRKGKILEPIDDGEHHKRTS